MKRIVLTAVLAFLPAAAIAAAVVGQAAPAFTATDTAGKPVRLEDLKGRTVVLEWHNFGCPFVQKHYRSGNMQALQKKYGADVVWVAVNSTNKSASDYMVPAKIDAEMHRFGASAARYVMDDPGAVGRAYGAKTTPHMFVIDGNGTLVYDGAIDDRRSTDVEDVKGARNYVALALDEMKAGKAVSNPRTVPYGCSVKYR